MTELYSFIGKADGGTMLFLFLCIVVAAKLIFLIYNRTLRAVTLWRLGYPPAHCDADGDFRDATDELDGD